MLDSLLDYYEAVMTPPGVFIAIGVQLALLGLILAVVQLRRRRATVGDGAA
jgi:hypothetical protein